MEQADLFAMKEKCAFLLELAATHSSRVSDVKDQVSQVGQIGVETPGTLDFPNLTPRNSTSQIILDF